MTVSRSDAAIVASFGRTPPNFWDFKGTNTGQYTHGMHQYPAMLVPQIPENILRIARDNCNSRSVLDPFMGSGTVLVESVLAGMGSVQGWDINPVANLIARVKTTQIDPAQLRVLCSDVLRMYDTYNVQAKGVCDLDIDACGKGPWAKDAARMLHESGFGLSIPDVPNMGYWFKPSVVCSLAALRHAIDEIPDGPHKNFMWVAFSECVRVVSNRRAGEFKMYRVPQDKLLKRTPDVRKEFSSILNRNMSLMSEFYAATRDSATSVSTVCGDVREIKNTDSHEFDLVVTSPPYGDSRTTVAYGEFSRLSSLWVGLADVKSVMGMDRAMLGGVAEKCATLPNSPTLHAAVSGIRNEDEKRADEVVTFYKELDEAVAAVAAKTEQHGYHFWVVGNRTVKRTLLRTDAILTELASAHGLKFVTCASRKILNKVMPSANSPSNVEGEVSPTMCAERIVVLRKE